MKKYIFLLFAVCSVLLFSCSSSNDDEDKAAHNKEIVTWEFLCQYEMWGNVSNGDRTPFAYTFEKLGDTESLIIGLKYPTSNKRESALFFSYTFDAPHIILKFNDGTEEKLSVYKIYIDEYKKYGLEINGKPYIGIGQGKYYE